MAILGVSSFTAMLVSRRKAGAHGAEQSVIPSLALTVIDVVTDCVFANFVWSLDGLVMEKLLSITFIVAPVVVNMALVFHVVGGIEMSRKSFSEYFARHRGAVSLIMVLGMVNLDNL